MRMRVIKNEKEHRMALGAIEALWGAKKGTSKGDALELLSTLVELYEERKHAILPPDPVEAIKFRLEQEGLPQSALAKILGGKNRASEILHHKRRLSLQMIRNLHRRLHIPAESLIGAG